MPRNDTLILDGNFSSILLEYCTPHSACLLVRFFFFFFKVKYCDVVFFSDGFGKLELYLPFFIFLLVSGTEDQCNLVLRIAQSLIACPIHISTPIFDFTLIFFHSNMNKEK